MSGSNRIRSPFVSVCMIARDEARFIGQAIRSVRGFADEVWVGDTGSRDDTVAIARRAGAYVFSMDWPNDFAAARNRVLERARGRWIFVLDADEWFPEGQARALRRDLALWDRNPDVVAFSIYQANLLSLSSDIIQDKSRTVRGFRNKPDHRYVNPIHEQILPSLRGGIVESPYQVIHAGFVPDVAGAKKKGERNLQLLETMIADLPPDHPHLVYLYMQRGREHQRQNALLDALRDYRLAADCFLAEDGSPTPFATVLFAYAAEVLYLLGRHDELLAWAERFRARVPVTQADLPFFRGLAESRVDRWEHALASFLEALACLEGAPYAQEYVSFDRTVLTHAGIVESLMHLDRLPEAWTFLERATGAYPDRDVLAREAAALMTRASAVEWPALLGRLPPATVAAVAHHALKAGERALCLAAVDNATRRGSPDALVWAAAQALLDARPDLALNIVAAVPPDHASAALARRLRAMAHWQAGVAAEFERLVEADDPVHRAGLLAWAGRLGEAGSLAPAGLQALSAIVPLPPSVIAPSQREAAGVAHH